MMTFARAHRHWTRAAIAVSCLALTVGLPFAIDLVVPDDALRGSGLMAANGDTVSISDTIALLPSMPLFLDRGVLQSIDATGVKVAETLEKLQIDNAVFRIPLSSSKSGVAIPAQSLQPLIAQLASLNVEKLILRNARIEFVRDGGSMIALTELSAEIIPSRRGSYTATAKGNLNQQDAALPEGRSW